MTDWSALDPYIRAMWRRQTSYARAVIAAMRVLAVIDDRRQRRRLTVTTLARVP